MTLREQIRLQGALFLVAVPLNLAWETLQIGAYAFPPTPMMETLLGCLLPSLGDGVMVLGIYWAGRVAFRHPRWILSPGPRGYLLMLGVGLLLAAAVEVNALYQTGAWAYNPRMPRLPWLGVGLWPILQMTLLPPLIAGVVGRALGHGRGPKGSTS